MSPTSFAIFLLSSHVVLGKNFLFVTDSGHSPAKQIAATANELILAHPEHTITFLCYQTQEAVIRELLPESTAIEFLGSRVMSEERREALNIIISDHGTRWDLL